MTRGILFLPIALLSTAFSGCLLETGSDQTLEGPTWSSGFAYAYETTGRLAGTAVEDGDSDNIDEEFDGLPYVLEVLNSGYTSQGERVYLVAIDDRAPYESHAYNIGSPPSNYYAGGGVELAAVRQRDLAWVPIQYGIGANCNYSTGQCSQSVEGLRFGPNPGVTRLDFPLSEGKSWSGEIDVGHGLTSFGIPPGRWAVKANVAGVQQVKLPVGTVETMRVDFTYHALDVQEWANELREEVEREGGRLDVFERQATWRERHYYSDAYQAIVRTEVAITNHMHLVGEDEEGDHHDLTLDLDVRVDDRLTGARLVPKPERGPDYVSKVVFGEQDISDPAGQAFKPAGYTLDLGADRLSANAALGETISFETTLSGADALPDGHVVEWRILDGADETVASGEGLRFSHAFDEPGLYGVQVEAFDGAGAATAADGESVAANYATEVSAGCGPVSLFGFFGGGLFSCNSLEIPVRVGIQSLDVQAVESSLVPFVNSGSLYLADGAGHFEEASGQSPSIRITDFSAWTISDQDWAAEWVPQIGILDDVTYVIDLNFEPPVAATDTAACDNCTAAVPIGAMRAPSQGHALSTTTDLSAAGVVARLLD